MESTKRHHAITQFPSLFCQSDLPFQFLTTDFLDMTKFMAYADYKFTVTKMMISVFDV